MPRLLDGLCFRGCMFIPGMEILPADRLEHRLNVLKGQNALIIIDEDKEHDMFLCVLLLLGRRQEIVLRVVVDHRLGEDLVSGITARLLQVFIHIGRHLIHVEIDVRNIRRIDQIDFFNRVKEIEQ